MTDAEIKRIREILREDDIPYFTDEQIQFYVEENGGIVMMQYIRCFW